jgi:hypothetical protein
MKNRCDEKMQFSLQQIINFCCRKQHLLPGSAAQSITQAATSLVGVHAARLITPYFALRARLPELDYSAIHDALHKEKTLIKARCMRGTLHLLPAPLFFYAHHATLTKRLGVCNALYKKLQMDANVILRTAMIIEEILINGPLSTDAIAALMFDTARRKGILESPTASLAGVRAVIKYLWEKGTLCYINENKKFGSEQRVYGLLNQTYPRFQLSDMDSERAVKELVRNYIRGYGPATEGDLVWWAGISKTFIRRAIDDLGEQITAVRVAGFDEKFMIMKSDLDLLNNSDVPGEDWVAILAHEDPSLKGYFSSRSRYVAAAHYDLLFNDIGESRPAIMLNGRVVGVWAYDKIIGSISSMFFEPPTAKQLKLIDHELNKVRADSVHLAGNNNFTLF